MLQPSKIGAKGKFIFSSTEMGIANRINHGRLSTF